MHIGTLEQVSLPQLTQAFNEAFGDYMIPLQLTEVAMAGKIKSENIQLHLSAGCFDGEALVAFILHGYDVWSGSPFVYNGGTGVCPNYRGQGLTHKMYTYLIEMLKAQGIYNHLLEVIEGNTKAIKAYQRVGFQTVRHFDCYKGHVSFANKQHLKPERITAEQFAHLQHWNTVKPSWQNSTAAVLRHLPQHQLWGVIREGECIACVAYAPANGRIKQIAVAPAYRRQGIGSSLLAWLQQQNSSETMTISNVDAADNGIKAFFKKSGMQLYLRLMEMQLTVAP